MEARLSSFMKCSWSAISFTIYIAMADVSRIVQNKTSKSYVHGGTYLIEWRPHIFGWLKCAYNTFPPQLTKCVREYILKFLLCFSTPFIKVDGLDGSLLAHLAHQLLLGWFQKGSLHFIPNEPVLCVAFMGQNQTKCIVPSSRHRVFIVFKCTVHTHNVYVNSSSS